MEGIPPSRRSVPRSDAAVNELIGTILLMAIAVGLVGVFVLVLFTIPGPSASSHTQLQTFVLPTAANELVIEHRGGPGIPIDELVATVTVNGTPTSYVVGDHLGSSWTVRSSSGGTKSASDTFSLGDQAVFASATLYKASASVQVTDASAAALTLGATIVLDTDATSPTFSGSRTTSTTTIRVNFSEPLRAILAADFTLGGSPPASVVLLGNGSAAQFTAGSAFATSDTPAVASIASPTGSFDVAGNLFAGSASTTPTDGVAPAITSGPTATPTSSTSLVAWTTGEAGTSLMRYGPTPDDLGLSQSGPSATSHSVTLVGLTDNFRYYYTVTTTDSSGNAGTSSSGNFVTSASGGGGGGSGDSPPLHLIFNQTFTPVTSGVPSDAGTPFRIAVRNATAAITAVTSDTTVTLTTNSSTGHFLDTAGTSVITSVTITSGTSFAEFRYVDFRNGGVSVLGATSANFTPVFTSVQVAGGTGRGLPYRLEFSTQDNSQASGTATSSLVLALRDPHNNLVAAPFAIDVNLSTNSTSGFFSTGAGPITAITIPATSAVTTTPFTYTDHRPAGTSSLVTASSQGILPATMQVAMSGSTSSVLGVGNRLHFTHVPTGLASGTSSATDYRVSLVDPGGRAIVPDQDVVVRLSTNSSTAYFLDPDGATIVTSRTLTTSNGTAWFKYVDYRSNGTSVLLASANGTTTASALVTVNGRSPAGVPDRIAWSTAPANVASGSVAGPFRLQLRDGWEAQTTAPTQRTATLLTNSTSGVFCSDASCATPITSVNFSAGAALSDAFYYRDHRYSAMSVLLASAPHVVSSLHVIAIEGGTPQGDHLAWTTTVSSTPAGAIAGPYQLTVRDDRGEARVRASALEVTLATNSTYAVFCGDASCSTLRTTVNVSAGASASDTFWYRDARFSSMAVLTASAARVTPAATIVAVLGGTNLTSPSSSSSNHLVWSTAPTTLAAGSIAGPYQLTLQDPLGAATSSASGELVRLSTNSSSAVFCSGATCATTITTVNITSGSSTSATFYYRDSRHSAMTVIAAFAPGVIPGAHVVAVTGGSNLSAGSDQTRYLALTGGPGSALNPGVAITTPFTVTIKDSTGSTVTAGGSGLTVTLETNSSLGTFLDASTGAPITTLSFASGDSSKTFGYVDNRTRGVSVLTARSENLIPASTAVAIANRGVTAEHGDDAASLLVFANVPNLADNNRAGTLFGLSVVNPTPSSFTVREAVFDASNAPTVTNLFNAAPTTGAGSDSEWTCTWSRTSSNNRAVCNVTGAGFTLGPYSSKQLVFSSTTSGDTSSRTVLNASVSFNGGIVARSAPANVFVDSTSDAAQIRLFAFNGSNPALGFRGVTGGAQNDFRFDARNVASGTAYILRLRFTIPAGWSNVSVNAFSSGDEIVASIRAPTGLAPGYVLVTSEQSSGGTFDFVLRATPPVLASPGLQLLEVEVQGNPGSNRAEPASFLVFPVVIP